MGSTTYEWVLNQTGAIDSPKEWKKAFGQTPVFVFSTRDLTVPDGSNVHILNNRVAEALSALKEAAGDGDIWIVGSGDLAGQFLDAKALDEVVFTVAPATYGTATTPEEGL